MKRDLWRRICSIALAGILTMQLAMQGSVPVFAEEKQETESTVQEQGKVNQQDSSEDASYSENEETSRTEESSTSNSSVEQDSEKEPSKETGEADEYPEEENSEGQSATENEQETTEETTTEEVTTEEPTTEDDVPEEQQNGILWSADNALVGAPTGLVITARTAGGVTLQWNTVEAATGYIVYRSEKHDAEYSEIADFATDSNVAAYRDTTAKAGKVYYYKVQSVVKIGGYPISYGGYSEIIDSATRIESIALNQSEVTLAKGEEYSLKTIFVPEYAASEAVVEWSSSNDTVVKVSNGRLTAIAAGTARITVRTADVYDYCDVKVEIPLQDITLDKESIALEKGKAEVITLSILPNDTTDEKEIEWSSSNGNVVEVKPNPADSLQAVCTAKAAGEADITARVNDKTVVCDIKVFVPATAILLNQDSIELLENEDSIEVAVSILPKDTTDTEITWELEDNTLVNCKLENNVFTIESKGVPGRTELIVNVGNKTTTLPITVIDEEQIDTDNRLIPVTDVLIQAQLPEEEEESVVLGSINLKVGDKLLSEAELGVKVLPENASNQHITWKTSDAAVVTVTQDGLVTAVGIGRATITAEADNGVFDSVSVIVQATDQNFRITSGQKVVIYNNENLPDTKGVSRTHQITLSKDSIFEFRSSNLEVATVDNTGLVTANKAGTAVITVLDKVSGNYKTISITVKRIAEDIKIVSEEITVLRGTKTELFFNIVPSDISKDCLATLYFEPDKKKSPITIDTNWTKGKNNGSVKFSADSVGTAKLMISAGDTYLDDDNEKVSVTSVQKIITVHVIAEEGIKVASAKVTGLSKMRSGTSQVLDTTVKDSRGNELDTTQVSLGYVSSNEDVAKVDSKGNVTALKGGSAVITVYALDGSNVKANFTVNVEQRPEQILPEREKYGLNKAVNGTASVTVKTTFLPSTTASSCKGLTWSIVEVKDADGIVVKNPDDYFSVNNAGTVTAKKTTIDGMSAKVRCTSTAYGSDEEGISTEVVVVVQQKRAAAVRFTTANPQVIGLDEQELAFTTTFVNGYTDVEYTASSSDTQIAKVTAVKTGKVTIQPYKCGTVTITLCADNMLTTTCKVTIYPFERGGIAAEQGSYLLQQAQYDGTDKAKLTFVDSKTKKIEINPSLLTYTSSNPDMVYVDKNGIAYANPKADGKVTTRNNQVTITAALKDDPDKRKATVKVVVCPTEQVERMAVTYYRNVAAANEDRNNTAGKTLTDGGINFSYFNGQSIVLRVASYGANNDILTNSQLSFTSSDTSVATIKSQTKKAYGSGNNIYEIWETVVDIKKAGRFAITIASKDNKGYNRKIAFGAYAGEPVLFSDSLGTINKNTGSVIVNNQEGIAGSQTFTILPTDGTKIEKVSVAYADAKIKENGKIQTVRLLKSFVVRALGNNEYQLVMEKEKLENAVEGTYNIVLNVTRSALPQEDVGFGDTESVEKTLKTSYKIANTLPKIQNVSVSINSFIRGDAVAIPIKTEETIEEVSVVKGMALANEVDIEKSGTQWFVKINERYFDSWKKKVTSGKINVKLQGYETPVVINLTVNTRETKPIVKQLSVPALQLDFSDSVATTLVDNKQQIWTDYTVECKDDASKRDFNVTSQKASTKITFTDKDIKLRSQGTTYTEKVLVTKPEWRSPIEVSLAVKAYNGASIPTVKFEQSTVYINRNVNETAAETGVLVSLNNVELTEGEWTIADTCKYKVTENRQTVWHQCSEAFRAIYQNGRLNVEIKNPDIVPNGTYKLTMTKLWAEKNDENLKQPLQTAQLSIVVRNVAPVVAVSMTGKLDLINRSNSTLQATVKVSNVNSTVSRIRLVNTGDDGFANNFYIVRKENTFTIYARSTAKLATKQVKGNIEITMSDGTVLPLKQIAFTPTQSTPKVVTPVTQQIYKGTSIKTIDYNFNQNLERGVHIQKIVATSVPNGLTIQDSNGHILVTLADKTLKPGMYKVMVNVYFKGAQQINTSTLGTPVVRTFYVDVRE